MCVSESFPLLTGSSLPPPAPDAVRRNFERWPIESISTWDRRIPIVGHKGSWEAEGDHLRRWTVDRMQWMDGEIRRTW